MPRLVPSDVHVNALTKYGMRWKNPDVNYISEDIFPDVPVKKETDLYFEWYKSAWFRDEVEEIAAGDPVPRAGMDVHTTAYTCKEYGLGTVIPKRVKDNSDSNLKLQLRKTEWLTNKLDLARERRVAANLFSASVWTHTEALAGVSQWNDYSNSSPIAKIQERIDTVGTNTAGLLANTMVMGYEVWTKLKWHPEIIRAIFGEGSNTATIVTPALVAKIFDLKKVLIGQAVYTASAEGTAEASVSYTKIWGKKCWIGFVTSSASIDTPTAGYNFLKSYRVRQYHEQHTENDVIEAREICVIKQIANDCGYLITAAVA